MFNVSQFLQKYQTFKNVGLEREKIANILTEKIGAQISKKDLILKDNILFVSNHPAIKNEIFLKKGSIISFLNTSLPESNIRDIR